MAKNERQLLLELELLHDKWTREWAEHVKNDTQPTREDERLHLLELGRVITDPLLKSWRDSKDILNELTGDLV